MSCLRRQPVTIPMDTVKIIQSEKFPRECPIPVTQPRFAPPPRVAWDGGGRVIEGEVIVNQACSDITLEAAGVKPPAAAPPPPPLIRRDHGNTGGSFLAQRKASVAGPTEICYHQFHYKMDDVIVNQYVLRSSSTSSSASSSSSGSSCSGPVMPCEPLDCPTCGHMYNFAGKRPRILSCLHSVCEECLQILYESCPKYKFISCPTCRRETVLFTDYGLAALAINTSILGRLPAEPGAAMQWGGDGDRSCYQTVRQYCQSACTCHLANPLSSCGIM
ncbi:LOW QUALITY PROTEIN: RING finger protein 208 [Denticeps clupeoides]|uniref:LOW QUALITY PROTEIN: RING finger protein 208 n=1 Tax=Denticeps clupeoides TaxID=299321 RepID=UPI0010A45C18|nr:LOW QUALITY PROTEIN: RING finger protein 208-like [Denticeps clupeoides]